MKSSATFVAFDERLVFYLIILFFHELALPKSTAKRKYNSVQYIIIESDKSLFKLNNLFAECSLCEVWSVNYLRVEHTLEAETGLR